MDKIKWCLKQKKGIKLIKPNENLSINYLKRAKSDYNNLKNQDSVWKIIISYYICYNSFYSILIRCGIKSEIHSCSIYLLNFFDDLKPYYNFIEELKELRTNVQYYLKEPEEINLKKIHEFLQLCDLELNELNNEKIRKFRSNFLT